MVRSRRFVPGLVTLAALFALASAPARSLAQGGGSTGMISLDRGVYPVPFGVPGDFPQSTSTTPDGRSVFPIHQTGTDAGHIATDTGPGLQDGEHLSDGDVVVHIRVSDADFDTSSGNVDLIDQAVAPTANTGPVKISVVRSAETIVLGYAGGPAANDGLIDVGDDDDQTPGGTDATRQFGPMTELAADAGIFEISIPLRFTDGPASQGCPHGATDAPSRFDAPPPAGSAFCILQGDILQVEYTDPLVADGCVNTTTDAATFDLRDGVLQSDWPVYILGGEMLLTLLEPDLDLDSHAPDSIDLDLLAWSSDAGTRAMGDAGGDPAAFDPIPAALTETGDSSGIFQVSLVMPETIGDVPIAPGEEIEIEYTDWGPAGSDFVGQEDEDVRLTIHASNFASAIYLDQKVYTWTDKVLITAIAPSLDQDQNLAEEIVVDLATSAHELTDYVLRETGEGTGVFLGDVVLTGFAHDVDGDGAADAPLRPTGGKGPHDGALEADDDDTITVSLRIGRETVVAAALIRWNIGEVQWLDSEYPAGGSGVVRVVDADMNLDPDAIDSFVVDVWSDSDAGGIELVATETGLATATFQGIVHFSTTTESAGDVLRVSRGDTLTAEYVDRTLPDPYMLSDELDISATSAIRDGFFPEIDHILGGFDLWVTDGTLVGRGKGNSANGRLGALRNMLEAAGHLLDANDIANGRGQLGAALRKTDGVPTPPDFVEGPDAAMLAAEIQGLLDSLGCP